MRRVLAALILIVGSLGVLRANSGRAEGESGWGFSEANLDRSCKPCDDFNQFAMGGWMKNNPIPAEYPNWGSFTMLADRNQTVLRAILEDAAKASYQPVTIFFGRRTRRSTLADLILFIGVVLYASLQVLVLGIGFLLLASLWLIYHQIFPSGVDLTHLEKISRSL
jgi:hypothetical protein